MSINPQKKRLAKIFGTYALTVSLLFGAGYGLQTAVNNLDKKPEASQSVQPQIEHHAQKTPAKYFWLPGPSKH